MFWIMPFKWLWPLGAVRSAYVGKLSCCSNRILLWMAGECIEKCVSFFDGYHLNA